MLSFRDNLLAFRAKRAGVPFARRIIRDAKFYTVHPALAIALLDWTGERTLRAQRVTLESLLRYLNDNGTVRRALQEFVAERGNNRYMAHLFAEEILQKYADWHAMLEVGELTHAIYRVRERLNV